jgi:hypothetical protein
MKHLKEVLFTATLLAAAGVASAAVVTLAAEGVRDGVQTGAPADADTWWAELTVIPPPSSTDLIHGNVGTMIGSYTAHNGSALDLAAFTDGEGDTAYPGQLPADGSEDGVANHCLQIFYDLGGATDVGSVVLYGFNYNNDNEGDVRAIITADVYTTTDPTPSAGGTWTQLVQYAHSDAAPLSKTWEDTNSYRGVAELIADDASGVMATGATGIRFDISHSGFGNELRAPDTFGVGVEAITSPFIAEIDVLPPTSAVNDWTLY